jgi:cytochrome c-type biogenesis protein CcmF
LISYIFDTNNLAILISLFAGFIVVYRYVIETMNSFFMKKYLNPFSAIAHFALGLLIISISFNSLLSSERALNIKINEFEEYKDLKIFFKDIKVLKNSNHDSIEATFVLENQKGRTFDLSPEKRRYFTRGQITTETAIFIMPLKDIYMTIGDQLDDGSWIVNIQINYLIRWIWFSAGLMAFAGMVLMFSKKNI